MDRNELKVQALLNANTQLQDTNANLRVEAHLLTETVQQLTTRVQELELENASLQPNTPEEPDEPAEEEKD